MTPRTAHNMNDGKIKPILKYWLYFHVSTMLTWKDKKMF